MNSIFSHKRFHLMAAGTIIILTLIAYSNTFTAPFHFDDTNVIVENPGIRSVFDNLNIFKQLRGLSMLSFAVNYSIGGLSTTGYHIVNTVIHIINAILAYTLILWTIRKTGSEEAWSRRIAVFTALFFALHPIQTQAVTYIVQRMESLSALFYLGALLFFIKGAETENTVRRAVFHLLAVISFILAFQSKEIAITLPAVMLMYDYFFLAPRGQKARSMLKRWPVHAAIAVIAAYFFITVVAPIGNFNDLSDKASGIEEIADTARTNEPSAGFGIRDITPKQYLLTQMNVVVYYMSLLLVPANQNVDYDFPVSESFFAMPKVNTGTALNIVLPPALSLAIITGILLIAAYLYRTSARADMKTGLVASFFMFWFFILLSPTSSFVPIIDVIFEHRVYLPSLGFFTVFSLSVDTAVKRIFRKSVKSA